MSSSPAGSMSSENTPSGFSTSQTCSISGVAPNIALRAGAIDGDGDDAALGPAEVVVRVPRGERSPDARAGLIRSRHPVHGADQHPGPVGQVEVDQRLGTLGVQDAAIRGCTPC